MEDDTLKRQQSSYLKEVGQLLCQTRQSLSISLDDVVAQTRIPYHHLQAIEEGNLGTLPPAIYAQGFIKIYANFLGCNGTGLASKFPTTLNSG